MKKLFAVEEIINGFVVTWTTPIGKNFTEFVETEGSAYLLIMRALEVYSENKILPNITGVPRIPKLQEDGQDKKRRGRSFPFTEDNDDNFQSGGQR